MFVFHRQEVGFFDITSTGLFFFPSSQYALSTRVSGRQMHMFGLFVGDLTSRLSSDTSEMVFMQLLMFVVNQVSCICKRISCHDRGGRICVAVLGE